MFDYQQQKLISDRELEMSKDNATADSICILAGLYSISLRAN